jgi:predicted small lipoprotein YifL
MQQIGRELVVLRGSPARTNLCMVAPHFGEFTVSRTSSPVPSRWAVILLTAAALALAGCGRKGGLDLPPTAAAPPPGAAQAEGATATPGSVFDPSFGANKDPVAPPGKKRSFILDPLLD